MASLPALFVGGTVLCVGVLHLARRYFAGGVCRSKATLGGKTVIITGANAGIGKETALDLARRGARVILACRDPTKGEAAAKAVRERSGNSDVVFRQLDLASFESIRRFASKVLEEEPEIHILINNAGVMGSPANVKTKEGFEMQFGVNHLGHFLLTQLLLDRLKEAPAARIINVSSLAHKFADGMDFDDLNNLKSYTVYTGYYRSKLANILFTRALAKRLAGTRVTANSLHPGSIRTELYRHFTSGILGKVIYFFSIPVALIFFKSQWEGAQTTIFCAVDESLEGVSGKYFVDCKVASSSKVSLNDDMAEQLWKVSTQLVAKK